MGRADIAGLVRIFGARRNPDGSRVVVRCSLCYSEEAATEGRKPAKGGGSYRILTRRTRQVAAVGPDGNPLFVMESYHDEDGVARQRKKLFGATEWTPGKPRYILDAAASVAQIRISCPECHGHQQWDPPHDVARGRAELRRRMTPASRAAAAAVADERQRQADEGRRNPAPFPGWLRGGT